MPLLLAAHYSEAADGHEMRQRVLPVHVANPNSSPPCRSIAFLVDIQASKAPMATALIDDNVSLSYASLSRRSTVLAGYLRSLGVRRGDIVGVALPRCPGSIIAALAVMKAGGAYLPLDPSYPKDRLLFEVSDAGVGIILTHADSAERIWPAPLVNVPITFDGAYKARNALSESSGRNRFNTIALDGYATNDDLAYVIYTSGSTGRPKGVEITHGGVSNLVEWHRRAFKVRECDRASHLSAVGFDAAVWEVWPYLAAGSSVYVADDAVARDPLSLRDWLVARRITLCFASAPLAERLIDLEWPAPTRLRALLTGADTFHKYPSPRVPFRLVNNYGPTETTVVATSGSILPAGKDGLPAIGRPITNARIYIVDANGERVPQGQQGEIWVGGAGVARGYHGLPALTAEKFIADPFDRSAGRTIFRTGDRGCLLPDGQIAFLGRIDDQVKIRGFRIEPREVEAALDRHPAIRESAVVAYGFGEDDRRLVSFVVFERELVVSASDIRAFLAAQLPRHMIPSVVVSLAALPITPNGKIDRPALSARGVDDALAGHSFVAPRTAIEKQLVQIVQPLLKIDRVSVDDDFFALGGHSLLGTQVISHVYGTFKVRISLRFLFESPTIAALAVEVQRLIQSRPAETGDSGRTEASTHIGSGIEIHGAARPGRGTGHSPGFSEIVALHESATAPPLFYLHGSINGEGFYSLELARALGADRPIYILPPHGVDGRSLPSSIEAMAAEYLQVIRATRPRGPYVLGGWCNGGLVAFEIARQLNALGESVQNVLLIEVEDANSILRVVVECIDRVRRLLKVDPHLRTGTVRVLARLPFQAHRITLLATRSVLVPKLRSMISGFRFRSWDTACSDDALVKRARRKLLRDFTRVGEAYVARRYEGKLTVLFAQNRSAHRKVLAGWKTVAPHVDVRAIPGDHITCVTEYFRETAKELGGALSCSSASPGTPDAQSIEFLQRADEVEQ